MPVRPNNAPMTQSYHDALKLCAEGGHILATRVYPNPYTRRLVKPDGRKLNADVPAITLDRLLDDEYVVGEALDPRRDHVRFSITPRGREGWCLDAPPVDPAQLGMFSDDELGGPLAPRTSMDVAA